MVVEVSRRLRRRQTRARPHAPGGDETTSLGPLERLSRAAATVVLALVYGSAARLSRQRRQRSSPALQRSGRALVVNTFHNPNWFRSHIRPLARCGVGEIILVCDEAVEATDNVRFECPPRWMAHLFSRAGAKFLWSIRCARHYHPDICIGYHIFPCAIIALVVARLHGRPACYQVTSGPLELEGGGWNAENRLLRALKAPSARIEKKAASVMREFDSVVVRGGGAERCVRSLGYDGPVGVITGSVAPSALRKDFRERSIDVVFVGRLAEYKRPDRFLAVMAAVVARRPGTGAVLIGDGPEANALRAQARRLGIAGNVRFLGQRSDVDELLARSRVFVLTSRWEGLSIAMLEAMAAGAVPVVADVGDLKDAIDDGTNGYLLGQDNIEGFAQKIVALLDDEEHWRRCSASAVNTAIAKSGIDAVAGKWKQHLGAVMEASRPIHQSL